jgi:hypothetical protein
MRGALRRLPVRMLNNNFFGIAAALLALGCGGSGTSPESPPDLVTSKVAVLGIAIATAGEGHAFFDNYVTCPRRGVINYANSPAGRVATVSGCDTGDGVVLDGNAEVRWVSGSDRSRITQIVIAGSLRAGDSNGAETSVGDVTVTGISFTAPAEPAVLDLVVAPVRVTANNATFSLDSRAAPANIFAPGGRGIDAIPNPTGSLDALTEADLKSIAYGTAMRLALLLFDETLESQRGEHDHTIACGTIHVAPDVTANLVRLQNEWNGCDLGEGIFVSGTFTQRWTAFDGAAGRVAMVVEGQPVIGGNVPRIALTRLEWSVTALPSPNTVRIAGMLTGASGTRSFSFELVVDD